MKDTFGSNIVLGSKVLYSTAGYRTVYNIGDVVKLVPAKNNNPDRVEIKITKVNNNNKSVKNPLVHAHNVVVL